MSNQTPTRRRRRQRKPSDGTMALVEHLKELRRRVIVCVLALSVGAVIGYIWYQNSLFGIPSLGEILREPYCKLPAENRAVYGTDGECRLLATSPFEMFLLRLKVGALAGSVLASPVWLQQIWGFITPGLHKNERRWTRAFVTAAVALFVLGAVLAYFILAYGLDFLLTIGDQSQVAALTGERYFSFILTLIFIFGVSFEVPLFMVALNLVGILPYAAIKGHRDVIWIVLTIFAAVMTPGQDPFSMSALAVALCLLVEAALQFMRIHDKRANLERPAWMDVDDESSSPLDTAPGGVDAPQPVGKAGGIGSPSPVGQAEGIGGPGSITKPTRIDPPASTFNNFDDVI
ncbi:twin-arginine translocase subunit TatC [Corynebacterium vitaeruminis]|uniref:Sec-independent protein translocase protein TatC n=1 Tax=Corynebacterium vitaeruminis DSM 20294 TaxID=1224164 RepID=W5Y1H3_9CORY|nr:twin-arginine translocase subunit TatC [Corynebacterium vitaeruminis]AHI22789.1 Sec-independent protein translocase protein [Corynebacterium vitaeruminis DSM 20294]